jgi:hypothetical protein
MITDTQIIAFVAANWPTLITGLMVGATYYRVAKFAGNQAQINKRVLKLAKLHAKRHPDDAAYIYDDQQE